jgi:DNA-binding response OmpR family regulator
LIGSTPEVVEAKRVILEGAGYAVQTLRPGESARTVAEEIGASLIVIDAGSRSPGVRTALDELCARESPSSMPVLVVGEAPVLTQYDGPHRSVSKPAEKRTLLDGARVLIETKAKPWSKRKTR